MFADVEVCYAGRYTHAMFCSGTDSGVIGRAAPVLVHTPYGMDRHLEFPRDGSSDAGDLVLPLYM